ncbi:MAG: hypothetical protein ACRDFX_10055 [Chloroflexota bacterium]
MTSDVWFGREASSALAAKSSGMGEHVARVTSGNRQGETVSTSESDFDQRLDEIVAMAEQLTARLRDLESIRRLTRVRQTLDTQPEQQDTPAAGQLRRLTSAAEIGISAEDQSALVDLLEAWVERPNDLMIVVKLSEKAGDLATLVRAFTQMTQLLAGEGSA